MEDDRLLLHAERYWAEIKLDMHYVMNISDTVWGELATLVHGARTHGGALRQMCLSAMTASVAHLYYHAYFQLDNYPLCMLIGDLKENV